MRLLVLGGSGHIGNAVARELVARGHDVTVAARSKPRPRNLETLDVRYLSGDLNEEGTLEEWCEGRETIVDAAAPYALNLLTARSAADQKPLDFAMRRIERLTSAVLAQGSKLVYVSSMHADSGSKSSALWRPQKMLMRAVYPYFAIKRQTEERIRTAMTMGLRATIFRPTACIGPWDVKPRKDCWIPKLLDGQVPAVLSHRINIIDTRDVGRAAAAAVEGHGEGQTVVLAGSNTTTEDLVAQLCESAGIPAPRIRMPAELSVLPLMWTESLWAMIGSASPLPSLVAALLCEQTWLEPSDFQQELGLTPRPLAETVRDTLDWYRSRVYSSIH